MSEVTIRPAGPADIAGITAIYADAVRHGTASFELEPPDEAEMARRQEALLARDFPYLVAEQAGLVAGYAYAGAYHTRAAYRSSVEDSIYIAPRFHRRGIGKRLLTRLVAEAEQRGFRQMIAIISDPAQGGSVALHAAVGFATAGALRSVGFKHGRWLDVVLMQRPLGSADTVPP